MKLGKRFVVRFGWLTVKVVDRKIGKAMRVYRVKDLEDVRDKLAIARAIVRVLNFTEGKA